MITVTAPSILWWHIHVYTPVPWLCRGSMCPAALGWRSAIDPRTGTQQEAPVEGRQGKPRQRALQWGRRSPTVHPRVSLSLCWCIAIWSLNETRGCQVKLQSNRQQIMVAHLLIGLLHNHGQVHKHGCPESCTGHGVLPGAGSELLPDQTFEVTFPVLSGLRVL